MLRLVSACFSYSYISIYKPLQIIIINIIHGSYVFLIWWLLLLLFGQMSTYAIRDSEEYKNFCDRSRDQRPQPEEVIGVSAIMFQIGWTYIWTWRIASYQDIWNNFVLLSISLTDHLCWLGWYVLCSAKALYTNLFIYSLFLR